MVQSQGGIIRKLATLPLLALLVAPLILAGPVNLAAQDPRIGSWTLVSAQSTLDPANKLAVTEIKDAVHVVMSGEMHMDFTAKANGHETPVSGNPAFNQVELHRINKRQFEVREKKNGALVATVRSTLSVDGNELDVTTVSAGHPDQFAVWTRISGSKPGSPGKPGEDKLAGQWSEDLSKTRLRQGLVLKIEPAASGGVRFSGEFSYTARFDGKPYDLKNSRNDTVTLALVDPHTVDATYQRDGQVAQKDRWVVSADQRQMTLTTTATLETGQHVNEKLVFRKQ